MKQNYTIKSLLLIFAMIMSVCGAWADTMTEGFESATAGTNYQGSPSYSEDDSDCEVGWQFFYGCVSTSSKITGSKSAALRLYTTNKYGYMYTTTPIEGLSKVEFKAKAATTNGASIKMNVSYSTDGESWEDLATNVSLSTTAGDFSYNVPNGGQYIKIAISSSSTKPSKNNAQFTVDDVTFTYNNGGNPTPTLSSIAVSGTPTKTTYFDGDKFSTDGLTVTGTYSDNTTETLTSGITWNVTPETLTTGTTSVSVTATVDEVSSASYTVNGLTVNAIPEKTIAEFIAAEGGKCYLTGVVSNIKNTTYGNYDLTDESGTIYVYGTLTSAGVSAQFASLDVEENDRIKVLAEKYELYNTTHEAKDVIFVENLGSVGPTLSSIAVSGTPTKTTYYEDDLFSPAGLVVTGTYSDASTKDLTDKAEWTITPSTGLTLGMTSVSVVATVDEVSSALFTVEGLTVSEKPLMYEVDFESATDAYTDWTFTNITSKATHGSVTAHGGDYFGTTGGKTTGSLQTKNKVALPNELTFYVSKQTNNTTSSTWKVEVSTDGTNWTSVKQQSATSMDAGEWVKVSQDLSSYKDVYVRIYYTGTAAVRCIDDVTLTYSKPFPVTFRKAGQGYSTLFTSESALTIPEGVEAYYCTLKENGNMEPHALTSVIPASTPVVLHYTGELTADKTINFAYSTEEGEDASANVLTGTDDALDITSITENDFYVLSIVDGKVGFYKFGGDELAAGKAFYVTAKAPVTTAEFEVTFNESDVTITPYTYTGEYIVFAINDADGPDDPGYGISASLGWYKNFPKTGTVTIAYDGSYYGELDGLCAGTVAGECTLYIYKLEEGEVAGEAQTERFTLDGDYHFVSQISTSGFILDFGFDGTTTGVSNVQTIAPAAKGSFDLQGRRVMGNAKGLLIKNGRVMLNR